MGVCYNFNFFYNNVKLIFLKSLAIFVISLERVPQNYFLAKIASFKINHETLLRGVYLSRQDVTEHGDCLSTFDVRLTLPNREPALSPATLHAMEHLAATFLRNHPTWGPKIVYWGPMGCLTGSYLIVQGDYKSEDMLPLLRECFTFIANFTGDIPGATPRDCGNYSLMDLPQAREVANRFLEEVLNHPTEQNLNYPD